MPEETVAAVLNTQFTAVKKNVTSEGTLKPPPLLMLLHISRCEFIGHLYSKKGWSVNTLLGAQFILQIKKSRRQHRVAHLGPKAQ